MNFDPVALQRTMHQTVANLGSNLFLNKLNSKMAKTDDRNFKSFHILQF